MRNVVIAAGLAVGAAHAGCSADPSTLSDGRGVDARRSPSPTEPPLIDSGAAAGEAPADSGAPVDGGGSGDGGVTDARADVSVDAAPPPHAFTGAGLFTPALGLSARKDAHEFAGNTPPTSPAKQACLDCHVAGGAAPAFAFGGTVFKDGAGTIPAAGVEIRLRAPDGSALSAYTDEDGNFYQAAAFTFPANAGVRNLTSSRLMGAAPPDGNCNAPQCHGSAHPWINLP